MSDVFIGQEGEYDWTLNLKTSLIYLPKFDSVLVTSARASMHRPRIMAPMGQEDLLPVFPLWIANSVYRALSFMSILPSLLRSQFGLYRELG
jgi:hypothetical protein